MPRAKTGVESFLDRQAKLDRQANDTDEETVESDDNSVVIRASTSKAGPPAFKRKQASTYVESKKTIKKKKNKSDFDVVLSLPDEEEEMTDKAQIGTKDCIALEGNRKVLVICNYWTTKTASGVEKNNFSNYKYRMPVCLIPNIISALNDLRLKLNI